MNRRRGGRRPIRDAATPRHPPSLDPELVLIWGQSNAVGQGDASELGPPFDSVVPDTQYLAQLAEIGVQETEWRELGPVTGGAGVELVVGRRTHRWVLKYGKSGTSLAFHWNTVDGSLWLGAVAKSEREIDDSLQDFASRYLVWIQGESDAAQEVNADAYEENLDTFIGAAQAELGPLTFIVSAIHSGSSMPFTATVRAAQESVAASRADTLLVDPDGLTLFDGLHYDMGSQIRLGRAIDRAIQSGSNATTEES